MLGVATTSHYQAEANQEAKRSSVIAYTRKGRGGPGPPRVIRTRPQLSPTEHTEVRRLRSVLWRLGAGTHQQIGAAIISFRHSSRRAVSASTGHHQIKSSADSLAAPLARGYAPQPAYIGRRPFPTNPAKLVPHWANRDQAWADRTNRCPAHDLKPRSKESETLPGLRGRGHGVANQRPVGGRRPAQAPPKRFNGRCRGPGLASVFPRRAARWLSDDLPADFKAAKHSSLELSP